MYYGNKLEVLEHATLRKEQRIDPPEEIKNIYIIGICGTAMGSLAGLLKQGGYMVHGYDEGVYPPMSTMLESLDITIDTQINDEHLQKADVIVVGNAIGPTHVVAEQARSLGKPLVSLPETLDLCVFGNRKRLVIAGTHGKTTTTGIVAAIFKEATQSSVKESSVGFAEPGYLIGGVMQGQTTGFDLGDAKGADEGKNSFFIIEGDEYDTAYFDKRPKFLTYGGDGGIVTSIELDHMDIYSDLKDYEQAFRFFVEGLPEPGNLFIAFNPDVMRVCGKGKNIKTYGIEGLNDGEKADVYLKDVANEAGVQKGMFVYLGEDLGELETTMSGSHNLMNIIGAAGLAYSYGVPFEVIKKGIRNFDGMKRRQEVVYDGYATLIDDFAHHPTAVVETIAGIKKMYEGRRLVALFEPRSNTSRRKDFEAPYIESLSQADCVILKQPELRHNDSPENYINTSDMVKSLQEKGINAYTTSGAQETINRVSEIIVENDVILMMSNGSFDGVREALSMVLLQHEK